MTNFDDKKSELEILLDTAISSLERTYPEQTTDAMADYAKVLSILNPVSGNNDIKPITAALTRLYMYPNRSEHNELLLEIHDLKEVTHELRINDILSEKKSSNSVGLGGVALKKSWVWVVAPLAILFLLSR